MPDREITQVDLSGLDGGLRHYQAFARDDYIELVHTKLGTVLRVKQDTFRSRLERKRKLSRISESLLALNVLESLLPALCVDCGLPVLQDETTLCGTCEDRQVADLLRICGTG